MGQATDTFRRALERLLAFDVDGYVEHFAENGSVVWPFAPPEWPHQRAEGREHIRATIGPALERARTAGHRLVAIHDWVAHETDGGGTVVAEFAVEVRAADGATVRLPYVNVVQLDADGRITELRNYERHQPLRPDGRAGRVTS